MSTPDVTFSSSVKSKYSPFCNGINKSHLTPCRQVGLSRKRKTPVSSFTKHSSENSNLSKNSSINSYSESETISLTCNKSLSKRKKNENVSDFNNSINIVSLNDKSLQHKLQSEHEDFSRKKPKKKLLETFTSEDIFNSNDDDDEDICCSAEVFESIEDNERRNAKHISNEEFRIDIEQGSYEKVKKSIRNLSSDFKTFENAEVKLKRENEKLSNHDSDDDFTDKNVNERKPKHVINTLSLRESTDNPLGGSSVNAGSSLKKCKIQLHKLNEDEINYKDTKNDKNASTKTLNKKVNSFNIDDADFFTSTPEEERSKRKNIEKKIKSLESQIRQKEVIMENLQRASVYKSKHNIQELKMLTSVWLQGCVQALKDLLNQLQAQGPIDLITLLNNMRIPKEIIAKLPLND